MHRFLLAFVPLLVSAPLHAKMPKEDVIDVPAIGEGLCVHNAFQSNMVDSIAEKEEWARS